MNKIILPVFFVIFLLNNLIFACSGSCLLCHKNLNFDKPKQHKTIKECISCHDTGCNEDSLLNDKSSDTSCGSDCFDCHNSLPNDNNHNKITECIQCHDKLSIIK